MRGGRKKREKEERKERKGIYKHLLFAKTFLKYKQGRQSLPLGTYILIKEDNTNRGLVTGKCVLVWEIMGMVNGAFKE